MRIPNQSKKIWIGKTREGITSLLMIGLSLSQESLAAAATFGPVAEPQQSLFNLPTEGLVFKVALSSLQGNASLNKVPLGFQDAVVKARKRGVRVVRFIQPNGIRGLSDSKDGIGPGHGKATSAIERALSLMTGRSWATVRQDTFQRALGTISFNTFESEVNQAQRIAGFPELTAAQLHNFIDVSFWKRPKQGEPDMAKQVLDSELYQLPRLAPGLRSRLIDLKLRYYEQTIREAQKVFPSNSQLKEHLEGTLGLTKEESKFVLKPYKKAAWASDEDKHLALFRFGSEPYFSSPVSAPPLAVWPPKVPSPPKSTPPLVPSVKPPIVPPDVLPPTEVHLVEFPPEAATPPGGEQPPAAPVLVPSTPFESQTPPWNRLVLLLAVPAIGLAAYELSNHGNHKHGPSAPDTEREGGGFPNTPPKQELPSIPTVPVSMTPEALSFPVVPSASVTSEASGSPVIPSASVSEPAPAFGIFCLSSAYLVAKSMKRPRTSK